MKGKDVIEKDYPTLYDKSGDIKDINTLLVPRGTMNSIRAEMDRLLIECGDEPLGGWDEWAKHQRPASAEHCAAVDAALGIVRTSEPRKRAGDAGASEDALCTALQGKYGMPRILS